LGVKGSDVLRQQLAHSFFSAGLTQLLRVEDRNAMAYSIESRVPFLTPDLVSFVFSLPEEYIINSQGSSKAILRRALQGITPSSILQRKDKIGFEPPEQRWMNELNNWVMNIIHSGGAQQIPVLNTEVIEADWKAILDGRKRFSKRLWRCISLISWSNYFKGQYE
jgi:asparagine synthase (glutamine-hydrolysing)